MPVKVTQKSCLEQIISKVKALIQVQLKCNFTGVKKERYIYIPVPKCSKNIGALKRCSRIFPVVLKYLNKQISPAEVFYNFQVEMFTVVWQKLGKNVQC